MKKAEKGQILYVILTEQPVMCLDNFTWDEDYESDSYGDNGNEIQCRYRDNAGVYHVGNFDWFELTDKNPVK